MLKYEEKGNNRRDSECGVGEGRSGARRYTNGKGVVPTEDLLLTRCKSGTRDGQSCDARKDNVFATRPNDPSAAGADVPGIWKMN